MKKYTVPMSVEAGGREQKAERLPALGTCPHSGHIPPAAGGGGREEGGHCVCVSFIFLRGGGRGGGGRGRGRAAHIKPFVGV